MKEKRQVTFSEFKRLCVVNSDKLNGHIIIRGGLYDWVGFGLVDRKEKAKSEDYEQYLEVID